MIFKSCLSPLQWTFARHVAGLWLAMAPQVDSEAYSFTNRVTLKLGTSQKWNPGRNPAKWIKAFFNLHRIWWIWRKYIFIQKVLEIPGTTGILPYHWALVFGTLLTSHDMQMRCHEWRYPCHRHQPLPGHAALPMKGASFGIQIRIFRHLGRVLLTQWNHSCFLGNCPSSATQKLVKWIGNPWESIQWCHAICVLCMVVKMQRSKMESSILAMAPSLNDLITP